MQKPISDKIQLDQTLNSLNDYGGVPSINDEGTLEKLTTKVDNVSGFVATGKADGDLSRYYANILPFTRQLQIAGEFTRKSYASITYLDKKQLEFVLDLTANTYSNYSTMEICLPLKFTKRTNKAQQMDLNMMTVNNFFEHWFTDIDIRRYPDDMVILPTNNSVSIANYSNAQMKHLLAKSVDKLMKTMLYYNKPVYLDDDDDDDDDDRRSHNSATENDRTDPNLTYQIAELEYYIFQKHVYRIPLTLICDLGKCNFAIKAGNRIIITLERNLNKLFESNKKLTTIPTEPDALIQIYNRSYVSYQEINLIKGADIYFTGILRSETALRQGVLESPYKQEFEVNTGTQDFTCTFKGAQRQFDWLEISIVYDKSYQHTTIYDSYDLELAAKFIQSIKFENTSSTYSLTGKLLYDFEREDDKHLLYKMFVAHSCNGCSSAPLTQYKNNDIYQEIIEEEKYFEDKSDERICIDMRRSKGYTDELEKINRDDSGIALTIKLKKAAAKKLRFRITGFSQAEYWYLLSNKGYIMSYKTIIFQKQTHIKNFSWIKKRKVVFIIKQRSNNLIHKI